MHRYHGQVAADTKIYRGFAHPVRGSATQHLDDRTGFTLVPQQPRGSAYMGLRRG
jgi:hypothetical protein